MLIKAARSTVISVIVSVLLLLILSAVIVFTPLAEESRYVIMLLILIFTSLLTGINAARGEQNRGWLRGVTAGAMYSVLLILIGVIISVVSPEETHYIRNAFITLLCSCVGGTIGINMRMKKA